MQPLISPIDHESRHTSYRAEDGRPSEQTPLLHRFPQTEIRGEGSTATLLSVALLITILVSGVIIGIYLLIVQNDSENVLPPIETPLELVGRSEWDTERAGPAPPLLRARRAVVLQTDTDECHNSRSCATLLQAMKSNSTWGELPYNFLVSSNGQTFESLGWRRSSPLYPQRSLVVAFIGNFTQTPPCHKQIDEAKNLFAESVSLQHLDPSYIIVGKNSKEVPTFLFESLKKLPQWNSSLSDG